MGPKIFDLGIFENNIVIYEASTLEFLKNEFFKSFSTFWCRVYFL